nr:MAG TPA: Protein of unknown function (DUF2806) [Caudoviricetes sp.]
MGENTQNGLVNVNLQPVADVANNLIDKFCNAVGWMATPRGKGKDFEAAVQIYIQEIQADDTLPPLVRAAKITHARKDIKEYINIQEILKHAQNYYRIECGHDGPLDDSWAMFFYDKAKNVTQDDVRIVWGKLLAGECCNPGSVPKQLVLALSLMDKKDVDSFNCLCQFCMTRKERGIVKETQLMINLDDEKIAENNLNSDRLLSLEGLGLINTMADTYCLKLDEDERYGEYEYHGKEVHIIPPDGVHELYQGDIALTEAGKALASLIVVDPIDGFVEYLQRYYSNFGSTVEVL